MVEGSSGRNSPAINDTRWIASPEKYLGLADVALFLRRHLLVLVSCVFAGVAIGAADVAMTRPVYVGSAEVLIHPSQPLVLDRTASAGLMQFTIDSSQMDSQIEILKSDSIAREVMNKGQFGLYPEAEPTGPGHGERGGSLLQTLVGPLWSLKQQWSSLMGASLAEPDREAKRLAAFQRDLTVRRIGQSYALIVSFMADEPRKAAHVANAVAAAYIGDQLQRRLQGAVSGGEVLQDRIDDLRGSIKAAAQGMRTGELGDDFPSADARVLTPATVPMGKSSPKTGLILLLAGVMGGLAGLIAVVLRRALSPKPCTREDIEDHLGLDLLGLIRRVDGAPKRAGLLTMIMAKPLSRFGDDIRAVQTSIDLARLDADMRCIGVTSCFPNEGKSTLACNLAVSYAMLGARTMLLDCDLRSPHRTAKLLHLRSATGAIQPDNGDTTLVATGSCDVRDAAVTGVDAFERSGVEVQSMSDRLNASRNMYELVIVDLPALATSHHARAMAPQLDGIILSIGYGRTAIADLARGLRVLAQTRVRIVGCVISNVPRGHAPSLW